MNTIELPSVATPRQRHWLWPTRPRVYVGLIIAFALWGWFDVRVRGGVDKIEYGLHKTDVTVYTEAGAAFFDGRNPYEVVNPRGWGYLYPPLFAILMSPLHALPTEMQALVWFAISVLLGWGCYRELLRIARRVLPADTEPGVFGGIPTWLAAGAISAAMLPALNCLQRGQVSLLKLYLLLLGFRLFVASRSPLRAFAAGLILSVPIAIKITPVIPVAFLMLQQLAVAVRTRSMEPWKLGAAASFGTAAGLSICLLWLPASVVGWQSNLHHLNSWWHKVATNAENVYSDDFAGDSTSARNQSFTNAVHQLGNWTHHTFWNGPDAQGPDQLRLGGRGLLMDTPWIESLLLVCRALAGGLLLCVGWRLARERDPLGQAAAFGLSCASTLVVLTIARAHYFVLLLPAITFVGLWLVREQRRSWALWLTIVPVALILAHYAWTRPTGNLGMLGVGISLWYVAACVAVLNAKPAEKSAAVPTMLVARRRRPAWRALAETMT